MNDLRADWSARYGISLTNEDVKVINGSLSNFFSLLRAWGSEGEEEVIENGKNNGSNVSTDGA